MKQVPVRLGPLALLLTVISICLTVLAILTFTTARADMALAEKYADTIRLRYELEAEGQSFLAEADAAAAEGTIELIDGLERDFRGVQWYTLERDGSRMRIGLRPGFDGVTVVAWKHERLWEEDDTLNLWPGMG